MKRFSVFLIIMSVGLSSIFATTVYKASATASYYAGDFHGKKTSNGEIFNMWAMTCAHKKLPFNTILKVTNLANGKNVQVRVNDRGPFVADREIDLSKGAASKLGMIGSGTAKVRLEIVSLGAYTKESIQTAKKACQMAGIPFTVVSVKKGQASSQSDNQTAGSGSVEAKIEQIKSVMREQGKLWDIQVGAFSMKENALVFARKVKKAGFENVVLQNTSTVVRVVLRAVESPDVNNTIDLLCKSGFTDIVVRERKIK